jgi:ferric-dicitrate binding protein FerR (iron transport regulator)
MTSTTDPYNPEHPDYSLGLEASQWLVRLTDTELPPNDALFYREKRTQAFLSWLRRSARHVVIFLDTYETYQRLGYIDPQKRIDVAALAQQARAESVDTWLPGIDAHHQPTQFKQRRSQWRTLSRTNITRWAAATGIVSVGLILITKAWRPELFEHAAATSTFYSTDVGERRAIQLEDGSQLTLNTASNVEILFTPMTRQERLINGEVFIKVQHQPRRPFWVTIDDVKIVDIGTQFDVYRLSNSIRVSVLQGSVQLRCTCSLNSDLFGGDQAEIALEGPSATLHRRRSSVNELERAIAWTEGHLSFNGESVSDVTREFNRYTSRHFVIADPSIAHYRIAGIFPSTDPDKLLEMLHARGIESLPLDSNDPTAIRLIASRSSQLQSARSVRATDAAVKP